jgi:hypothetical protein
MRSSLGQRVIVENVTGPDGTIGVGRAARARPDGYTVHVGTTSTILNGALYSLQYEVLNDFVPIAATPVVLYARNTMPAKDINELLAWLKANPNRASVGFQVPSSRLLTAFFHKETGTELILVPYRTGAMQDLVAGPIEFFFANPDQLPPVRAGAIKAYVGDKQGAPGDSTRHSDLQRDRTARAFLFGLDGAFRAPGHAKRDRQQAQRGGHLCPGRPNGAVPDRRSRDGFIPGGPANAGSTRRAGKGRCGEVVAAHRGVRD